MRLVEELPREGRVLVVRLRSLGDCVLTTPALSLLRAFRPDLEIAISVEPRFVELFEGHPAVNRVLTHRGTEAARFHPHLAINFHGGSRSARLIGMSMARLRAGFAHFAQGWVYNIPIPRAQQILGEERTVHTAEHLASAMFYLGVPKSEIPRASLPCPAPGPERAPYAVIHPCASAEAKAWPAARFAELGRFLKSECGLEPVFIGAAGDNMDAFAGAEVLQGAPLKEVMRLIAGARLFAGNDSGPAHMAAAFGRPVVVLYGTSDPVIWAPWRTESEIIVAPEGLETVETARVRQAAQTLLGRCAA